MSKEDLRRKAGQFLTDQSVKKDAEDRLRRERREREIKLFKDLGIEEAMKTLADIANGNNPEDDEVRRVIQDRLYQHTVSVGVTDGKVAFLRQDYIHENVWVGKFSHHPSDHAKLLIAGVFEGHDDTELIIAKSSGQCHYLNRYDEQFRKRVYGMSSLVCARFKTTEVGDVLSSIFDFVSSDEKPTFVDKGTSLDKQLSPYFSSAYFGSEV